MRLNDSWDLGLKEQTKTEGIKIAGNGSKRRKKNKDLDAQTDRGQEVQEKNEVRAERRKSWIQTQWLTSNGGHTERKHTQTQSSTQKYAYEVMHTCRTNAIRLLPPSPTHQRTHSRSKCHQRFPALTFCTEHQTTGKRKYGRVPRATAPRPQTQGRPPQRRAVICVRITSVCLQKETIILCFGFQNN